MPSRIQTGIGKLDKSLQGGLPPGAIVTVETDSIMQGEFFLHEIMEDEESAYISTIAVKDVVKAEFQKSPVDVENGGVNIVYVDPGSILQNMKDALSKVTDHDVVVVNVVNQVEDGEHVGEGEYQKLLNWMGKIQRKTGGVVILHRLSREEQGEYEHLTHAMSDIIFKLEADVSGSDITNWLYVPKCRGNGGGGPFSNRKKLNLHAGVSIDTSRDIA